MTTNSVSSPEEATEKKGVLRNRFLVNPDEKFQFNAWDDVQWTEEQEKEAFEKVVANSKITVSDDQIRIYDNQADQFWDKFYETHQEKFFKDRKWLFSEFPELLFRQTNTSSTVFEIGCGVGNTTIPILQENIEQDDYFFIYSCDFSAKAIELLKNHKSYDRQRCHAFVFDVSITPWCQLPFAEFSLDFATMIFVLSAIRPDKLPFILHELCRFMKPGGLVFFRDYGRYDLAQLRLKAGQCIGDHFYVRGDGTQVHFFTKDEIEDLFNVAGFEPIDEILVDRRLQVNRIKSLTMYRVWIQAKFRKRSGTS